MSREKMKPHEKIISQTAKEILVPIDMFRKGSSRIWVEDNGWFLTVVEFGSHYYVPGTKVNVRMEALWEAPGIDFLISISKFHQFNRIDYEGADEVFKGKMNEVTHAAKNIVLELRKYRDIQYAKEHLPEEMNNGNAQSWVNWNRAMLAYFCNDLKKGDEYLNEVYKYFQNMAILCGKMEENHPMVLAYHKWIRLTDEQKQAQVMQDIKTTRLELRTHSSWKKLKEDLIYG